MRSARNDDREHPTVTAILECLRVRTARDYARVRTAFTAHNADVESVQLVEQQDLPGPFRRTYLNDACSMVMFRVRDDQGHTVKELNAIAMDTAVLICEPEEYQDSRAALNDGQDDSFFRLLTDKLESDGQEALDKLRQGGNAVLLESYCSKFEHLLQAAEQEPDGKDLTAHLQKSPPGRLYATIESKL